MPGQNVSITSKGASFHNTGGYREEIAPLVKVDHIGNKYTTTGNNSPIAGNDYIQSLEQKKTDQAVALANAQIENTKLSSQLLALQIREAKYKRTYAVLGAMGGSLTTYIFTHVKEILRFLGVH